MSKQRGIANEVLVSSRVQGECKKRERWWKKIYKKKKKYDEKRKKSEEIIIYIIKLPGSLASIEMKASYIMEL
jgi:hypothetical protein